jgi:murein DD-endopeptidase MepM/ murein hydrolase activator NlpD
MCRGRTPGPIGRNNKNGNQNVRTKPGSLGHKEGGRRRRATGSRTITLECFPVYYPNPAGYNRPPPPLAEGETTFVIWFGNSFFIERGSGIHGAIDITTPIGLPVYLTTRQTVVNRWRYRGSFHSGVTSASEGTNGGNCVRTIDDNGFIHYYSHMSSLRTPLHPGVTYPAGYQIGLSGNTGNAGGDAHLHYKIQSPRIPSGPNAAVMEIGGVNYDTFGGRAVNPYTELVRLSTNWYHPFAARRIGPNSTQYELPIPRAPHIHRTLSQQRGNQLYCTS